LGIGDILYAKAILDNIKNGFDQIYVSPAWSLLDQYSPERADEYRLFVEFLFNRLFSETPYKITWEEKYSYLGALQTGGFRLVKPDIRKYFKNQPPEYPPYIVVTTKVRGTPLKLFGEIHTEFIKSLYKLSEKYTIILLGERKIGMNNEYKIHGPAVIYSIYDYIPKTIPNLVDLTAYDELGISSPNISIFTRDCNLMAHSSCTITVGCGGNFCLASALSNTVGFSKYGDGELVLKHLYMEQKDDTVQVYPDGKEFLEAINKL
jgi:hypothetical protein